MIPRQPTIHDHGIWAEHDVACPVCSSRSAILHLWDGTFNPCDMCSADGWVLRRRSGWWAAISRLFGR